MRTGGGRWQHDAVLLTWPRYPPTLADDLVRLRPWRAGDAAAVHRACQDPDIQRWTRVPVPYEQEHADGFVGTVAEDAWRDRTGVLLAITDLTGEEVLGAVSLLGVDADELVAEIGYWVAPWGRGRGTATRATVLLVEWAFGDGGLDRLELLADPDNVASCRVAEAAGFRREGLLQAKVLHRGARRDMVLHARVRALPG